MDSFREFQINLLKTISPKLIGKGQFAKFSVQEKFALKCYTGISNQVRDGLIQPGAGVEANVRADKRTQVRWGHMRPEAEVPEILDT